jgi:hypothetical protein
VREALLRHVNRHGVDTPGRAEEPAAQPLSHRMKPMAQGTLPDVRHVAMRPVQRGLAQMRTVLTVGDELRGAHALGDEGHMHHEIVGGGRGPEDEWKSHESTPVHRRDLEPVAFGRCSDERHQAGRRKVRVPDRVSRTLQNCAGVDFYPLEMSLEATTLFEGEPREPLIGGAG